MKLTIVGCAGSYTNATSAGSCYLLEFDGYSLLLDLGSGALGALAKSTNIANVDAVALSHVHLDHCADVAGLYVTRRYDPTGMAAKIPFFGPPQIAARMDEMYGLTDQDDSSMTTVFDFVEYDGSVHQAGPFTIATVAVDHCIPAFAIKVSAGGRSLVYSGDTSACQSLVELSTGADLALYEASYVESGDNPRGMHMTGAQAGRVATQAGIDRLVLTHLVAWNDDAEVQSDAATSFSGDLVMAQPGMTITV